MSTMQTLPNTATPARIFTIAGSDSGGGAGIQADLRTITALGGYGCSAITVITAQNTIAVNALHALPAEVVSAQIDAVLSDIGADACKTGMLGTPALAQAIAQALQRHWQRTSALTPLVIDTVLRASTGADLTPNATPRTLAQAMVQHLFPLASLVTPNLDEAAILLNQPIGFIQRRQELTAAAQALLELGCKAVLLKGGHLPDHAANSDTLVDYYRDANGVERWFEHPRSASKNLHGTGCTLSAAIATGLGQGLSMLTAVERGIDYTAKAITAGEAWQIGRGAGPLGVV